MAVTSIFDFTNPANYETTQAQISGNVGKLNTRTIQNTFQQIYSSDVGFTYESAKAEFIGGVLRQKDQTPANATFGANFSTSIDGAWGAGTLAGTAIGTPQIDGGMVDLTGLDRAVNYSGTGNFNHAQIGCIRFKFKPAYSGVPANDVMLFSECAAVGSLVNLLSVYHRKTDGMIVATARDSAGNPILDTATMNTWFPTAGTTYEIEVDYNFTAGQTRLFLNGVQQGTTKTQTGTRSTTIGAFCLGSSFNNTFFTDGHFDDLQAFSSVQHTADFTPGYSVLSKYAETKSDLPAFVFDGLSDFEGVSIADTSVGSPKYIVDGKYWTGATWATSNGSYAQASTAAQINTNIPTLALPNSLIFSVVFPESATQSSVDQLSLVYDGTYYYDSGSLKLAQYISVQEFFSFAATETTPAGTTIKYILEINGVPKYWSGSAWIASNGTMAQANTETEVHDNISTITLIANSEAKIIILFETTDILATPEITDFTVEYDFGGVSDIPTTCLIYGYLIDITGTPLDGATVLFSLSKSSGEYKEATSNVILGDSVSVLTNSDGYFEVELIRSSEYEGTPTQYRVIFTKNNLTQTKISNSAIMFSCPDLDQQDITAILIGG